MSYKRQAHFLQRTATLLFVLAASSNLFADVLLDEQKNWHENWREQPIYMGVKFDRFDKYTENNHFSATDDPLDENFVPAYRQHHRPLHKNITREYDATFFYPFRKSGMNMDLGVNIRFLNGHQSTGNGEQQNFQQTLPMFYAAVLFDLPVKGLSAGFEGRHMESYNDLAYEYRAKVRYQWGSGLGLQGGWQQQFLGLDRFSKVLNEFENEGPYLDLYFRF